MLNTGLDLNFGMAQFQPFKNKKAVQEKFWDGFRFGLDLNTSISLTNQKSQFSSPYDFTITNVLPRDSVLKQQEELRRLGRISNTDVYDISLSSLPFLLSKANITTRFSVPLSLPNIKLGKYLNITPGISLQGDIYNRRLNYEYRGDNNPDQFVYKRADGTSDTLKNRTGVRIDTTYGAFVVYNYSLSASANTRLYGILPIRIGRLQAIRHTISPSISASYTPDFSQEKFGFFQQNVQVGVEKDGKPITRTLSRFNPGAYAGESGSLSFSLSNQFEAKLRSKSDTAAKEFEKLSLLDNFNVSASYNFLAKEYALSNISLSTSTRVSNFDISWNGNLDPYVYVEQTGFDIGQRVSRYRWQDGLGFAKLSSMNFSISRRFSPSKDKSGNTPSNQSQLGNGNPNLADTDANKAQLNQINRTINDYIDWKVPWNLAINYNYSYSSPGLSKNPQIISSLTFNGDISISEKWRMTLSSGYDFKYNAFTYTNVSIVRDLHCWEILFNWIPIASPLYGRGSSYDFTIRAKSSLLQELKLTKRRSFFSTGGF